MQRWPWSWVAAGTVLGCVLTLGIQFANQTRSTSKKIKQSPKQPSTATIGIIGDPALGSEAAPVTIVEFSDFECPYCKRFHEETLPRLKQDYINKGLVRFIHKDLPLPFHQNARLAAITARCAQEEGKYWEAYEALFNKQTCLACQGPIAIIANTGIKPKRLEQCSKKNSITQAVSINTSEAEVNGIRATPTFVIGPSSKTLHRGKVIEGAIPWTQFQKVIEDSLSEAKS